jgi:carbon starvation protein CstA
MALIIQLALDAFRRSLSVQYITKPWEATELNQKSGGKGILDIGMRQTLRKKRNVRIDKVSAMGSSFAEVIEILFILTNFECSATDLKKAANVSCIDYTVTQSLK